MAEIRDGLTTEMKYAVISTQADFGEPMKQHGADREFWGMRKPPFEAYKIVEVMRSWGVTVYPVGGVTTVAELHCYPALRDLPQPVDCAIISLPRDQALAKVDDVIQAGIGVVWLQFGAGKTDVRRTFESRGVRVVNGCLLLHWSVDHVHGATRGRHICFLHGNLERAARIRVDEKGIAQRIELCDPAMLPLNSETYGTKILLPFWPNRS